MTFLRPGSALRHLLRFRALSDLKAYAAAPSTCRVERMFAANAQQAPESMAVAPLPPCWSCRAVTTSLLACASCGVPMEDTPGAVAGTVSHFAVLGLKPSMDLDARTLEAAARAAQRRVHPDRFSGSTYDARTRAAAAAASARVNAAARALRSPLSRAQHLLDLRGAGGVEKSPPPNSALLAEVLGAREALDDVATSPTAVHKLGADTRAHVAEALAEARVAFAACDLSRAAAATVALRYWSGLAVSIENEAAARGLPPTPAAEVLADGFGDGAGGRDV